MNRDDRIDPSEARQALSALADGEAAAAELACRAWRDDANARADWHTYHLIGELLRSDDVRCTPQHDARFLSHLRERLAAEPVPLAPTPAAAPSHWRRAWAAPLAIAAGFVAVAGVVVVTRVAAPVGASPEISAQAADAATARQVVGSAAAPASAGTPGLETRLIRSAELDRYLAAHRQYSSSSALAVPGGMVRNAATAVPGR